MQPSVGVPGTLTKTTSAIDKVEYQYFLPLDGMVFDYEAYKAVDANENELFPHKLLPSHLNSPILFDVFLKVLNIEGKIFKNQKTPYCTRSICRSV